MTNALHKYKFSAIVPNYNSSTFLPKALHSLLHQTESFHEIIIVDDGSTDDSLKIIDSFMAHNPVIQLVRHQNNQGVSKALNTGILHATGDYIILCAADDSYDENIVKTTRQILKKNPDIGLICGNANIDRFDMIAPFLRTLPFPKNRVTTPEDFKSIIRKQYVGFNGGGGMFMQREAVVKAGMLYPETRWHSDWLLYFVIALRQGFFYSDSLFTHIHMRKESYSENKKNWPIQKEVMINTIELIKQQYPELWIDFKEAALLPFYSLRCMTLCLYQSTFRQFFSFALLWKSFINNKLVVKIGRLFPYKIILQCRKFLRS